jgi:hypothetical protein
VASSGQTGSGIGEIADDGIHLTVEVQDHATRVPVRHTLHKGHLPNQCPGNSQ